MTDVVTEDIRGFDPSIKVPYADTWSAGVQRGIGSSMALEVRYVGTRGRDQWRALTNGGGDLGALNYNEFNIFDNGFVNEFRVAQSNLQANIAAGRGNTFAYTGAPGTSPLPTFLAFFNGQNASQSGNAALYTGDNWTNQNYLNFLAIRNPNPFGFASAGANGLMGTAALRANAATAGVPANYLRRQPRSAWWRPSHDQHRLDEVRRIADRASQTPVAGTAVPDQLRLRQGVRLRLGNVPRAAVHPPRRGYAWRSHASVQVQRRL